MNKRKTTMVDVAKHANVSLATVSHVINETKFVSPELKERVQSAMTDLEYVPDLMAKNFKKGTKKIIGYIVPDMSLTLYGILFEMIEQVVSQEGYNIFICTTDNNPDKEKEKLRLLTSGLADGIILASCFTDKKDLFDIIPDKFPIVLLDRYFNDCSLDSVCVSATGAFYEATFDLASDHDKIGYLAMSPVNVNSELEKLNSYKRAISDCKAECSEDLIQCLNAKGDNLFSCIDRLHSIGCSAFIVSGNSNLSLKALDYLQNVIGLQPRTEFDIVGYNNNHIFPSLMRGIFEQQQQELGRIAAERILRRIATPTVPPEKIVFPCSYIKTI